MSDQLDGPVLCDPITIASDLIQIGSFLPIPGHGTLAINSFLVKGAEPVLVDTGFGGLREAFMTCLEGLIDLTDLKWIWLSHTDVDHMGALTAVLDAAPSARIATNFLGVAKMNLLGLPVERAHVLQPGDSLVLADRTLVPVRPPYYDAPETQGFFDSNSRALFAADAFGALIDAPVETARDLAPGALAEGMAAWSAIDAPWIGDMDDRAMHGIMTALNRLDPSVILSGHLPAAPGMARDLVGALAMVREVATPNGLDVLVDSLLKGTAA